MRRTRNDFQLCIYPVLSQVKSICYPFISQGVTARNGDVDRMVMRWGHGMEHKRIRIRKASGSV